ncbi:MAG: DegT/DnrJ/EryC1/StrS family aminotransferase [Calditrichota bacterium]
MTTRFNFKIHNKGDHQIQVDYEDTEFIQYCQHSIDDAEILEVIETLKSNWLTKGPRTVKFEEEFSTYVESKYTIAVNSCTSALHLALAAQDIQRGDEIITTPFTFCATAEVIEYLGAKPVFVDIDPESFNIDVTRIEEKITSKTRAIIPVHYGGIPCNLNEINRLAEKYGLFVVEDAAHALGSVYNSKKIGGSGNATAFSFYPTKNITTGEGGALTTNDNILAKKVKMLSLHGISKDAWKRYCSTGHWFYEVFELGYKYNFTDIQAALGLQQLKKLDYFNAMREQYAHIYFEELNSVPEIELPRWYRTYFNSLRSSGIKNSWHLFVILLAPNRLGIDRDRFIEEMRLRNIGCSVHFIPLHFHPYYAKKYKYKKGDFPVSESVYSRIVSLPLYPRLSQEKIRRVCFSIKEIIDMYRL